METLQIEIENVTSISSIGEDFSKNVESIRPQKPFAIYSEPLKYSEVSSEAISLELPRRVEYFHLPDKSDRRISFQLLQKWEGFVLEVGVESFSARLKDLTGDNTESEADIPIDELPEDEREYLMRGSIFYWTIGYRNRPSGRIRESQIQFRRLPEWSKRELEKAEAEAARLAEILGLEN